MKNCARVALAATLAMVSGLAAAHADDYPNAPIHLISGFPPGSTADISARVVGAKMGQILGQQFVIENRVGAGSSLAAAQVARAPKDGYTLYVGNAANVINAAMSSSLNFDFYKDFEPVALITSTPTVLAVTPELGVKSVKELIALAKAKPGTLNYIVPGTFQRVFFDRFNKRHGTDLVAIPFKGGGDVLTGLLSGVTPIAFIGGANFAPYVKEGRMVALAVDAVERSPLFPDAPTMAELGYAETDGRHFCLTPRVLRLDPAMALGQARDLDVLPNTLPPEKHLGYAVQWFGLALAALVTALVLTFRTRRR